MSDLPNQPSTQPSDPGSPSKDPGPALFAPSPTPSRSLPPAVWVVAGVVVLGILAALLVAGRHQTGSAVSSPLAPDPYAANLEITGAAMSESTSLSGGKSTFLDGHIRNTGPKTVTGATVQVFFRNEEGMPPAIETLPISLVRTREPYVDTQPISAAPLVLGDDREFRLIFETIPGNWNVQLPEIRIVHVTAH